MKRAVIVFGFMLAVMGCDKQHNNDSKKSNDSPVTEESRIRDSLAFELCAMYAFDQGIRDMDIWQSLDRDIIIKIDEDNFLKLSSIVEKYGYPNKELLGEKNWAHECVYMAATAIMLHNPHRLINEVEYFDLFVEEVNKGNMSRSFLADVLDKYYWSKSRGQSVMYGSQFGKPCIDTKEETNRLRKEIGLEPLESRDFVKCD